MGQEWTHLFVKEVQMVQVSISVFVVLPILIHFAYNNVLILIVIRTSTYTLLLNCHFKVLRHFV